MNPEDKEDIRRRFFRACNSSDALDMSEPINKSYYVFLILVKKFQNH
jgi:hypothetical protein